MFSILLIITVFSYLPGSRCDVCADNYYGNPEVPGGSCQPCECSKNVDITRPGNCDPSTGKCLQCLFNTEGDHCEMCRSGYYRLDPEDRCIECVCNILGTNRTAGPCDRNTGQCHCLKNVIGQECDSCADNHWKIASGEGCERCDCDGIGSLAPQCNLYDGQCSCKEHFGGRQCNECQANHWGNPNEQCLACECDPDGAETMQCNRENGSCICRPGIGGYNCDTCARGYIGDAPHCSPCGECFDNWDRILNERHQQTLDIIDKAKKMKTVGAAGGYTREFEITEQQLDEIKDLLSNTSISAEDMQKIEDTQNMLDDDLKLDSDELKDIEEKILNNVTQEINLKQIVLNDLRDKEQIVKDITNELKSNATLLQEENVQGALGLIHDARDKAFEAENQVNSAKRILDDTERQCKNTENLVNRTVKEFQETKVDIDAALETLQITLDEYNAAIPDINNQTCDKRGDPCDSLCGGAGCGFCGGVACEQGATKKADNALFMVKASEESLRDKELKVDEMLRATIQLKEHVNEAKNLAKKALEKALEIDSKMNSSLSERNDKTESMRQFLNLEEYNPNDIIKLVEKTNNMNIKLEPEEIRDLDNKIKNTLASLTNIDVILRDTAPSLDRANSLKKTANEAKENANSILNQAERIIEALKKAENAQNAAKEAIGKVNIDIDTAKKDLIKITSESNTALSKANETASKVDGLQKNLKRLQENVLKNNLFAAEVGKSVKVVEEQAKTSENQARKLKEEYDRVNKTLVEKSSRSHSSRDRANELLQRALKLTLTTNTTLTELHEIQTAHHIHEKNLKMLSDEIDMLNEKLKKDLDAINEKVVNLEICS